jgi:regulator of sirC expression with transglutaminase-like and TPR domain
MPSAGARALAVRRPCFVLSLQAPVRNTLRTRFAKIVQSPRCELARGALEIARIAYPDLDETQSLAELDRLADGVRPRLMPGYSAVDRALTVSRYLFGDCGFTGNAEEYYDVRNSFLNDVLTRRTGIPITLSTVLMEVGTRVGVPFEGVGFPGHFLVRVPAGAGEHLILDPFHGGQRVDDDELLERLRTLADANQGPQFESVPPDFLTPTSPRAMLGRMLRNLLRVYLERDSDAEALLAVDLLLVLTPQGADEIRTRGFLYERLGCPAAAANDFNRYLELAPDADDVEQIRTRISRLHDDTPTLH